MRLTTIDDKARKSTYFGVKIIFLGGNVKSTKKLPWCPDALILRGFCTVTPPLGPLHFIWWIKAKSSAHQENKVSWGGKMTATQTFTISLSIQRLKEYSFTPFHHVFWKRTIFEGVPVLDILELMVPKVHWGLKNMWKKLQKFPEKFDDFPRNFVSLLFQIFLRTDCFQILPLDGGPQQLIHVKLC